MVFLKNLTKKIFSIFDPKDPPLGVRQKNRKKFFVDFFSKNHVERVQVSQKVFSSIGGIVRAGVALHEYAIIFRSNVVFCGAPGPTSHKAQILTFFVLNRKNFSIV